MTLYCESLLPIEKAAIKHSLPRMAYEFVVIVECSKERLRNTSGGQIFFVKIFLSPSSGSQCSTAFIYLILSLDHK